MKIGNWKWISCSTTIFIYPASYGNTALIWCRFSFVCIWISEKRKGKTYISNYNEFCLQYSCRYDLHFMPRKFLFPFLFFVQIIIYQLISNELLIYQTVNYMQYDYLYTMLIILLSERSYFTSLAQCNSNELCEWINDATHKIQCLILYRICL